VKTIVFVGPTLVRSDVASILPDAEVTGPVACGDVLKATQDGFRLIVIVDGVFEHRLPVWHKEILWAMARGARVFGGGSMGALRACELAPFGMIGVGRVFEWFEDGTLEDDDEVAVAHEDFEGGYRARSEAMVNIRATLEKAVATGGLSDGAAEALSHTIKAMPYALRSLRAGIETGPLDGETRERFLRWLKREGMVDQKRIDALALLRRVSLERGQADHPAPPFEFSQTEVWQEFVRSTKNELREDRKSKPDNEAATPVDPSDAAVEDILEELQLGDPDEFHDCWAAATERAFLRRGIELTSDEGVGLRDIVAEVLPEILAERGTYATLAARAAWKSGLLSLDTHASAGIARAELLAWHWDARGRQPPANLEGYARGLAFADTEEMIVAIAREWWCLNQGGPA
jgi:hypothetical protein